MYNLIFIDILDLVSNEYFNAQRKVFPSEKWDELVDALRAKLRGEVLSNIKAKINITWLNHGFRR